MMLVRGLLMTVGLLLIWQAIVVIGHLPPFLLPGPKQVFITLYTQHELIIEQTLPTLYETLLGYGLGILVGGLSGLLLASYRPLSLWFLPILIISQAIPTFAIAPLLVMWLGYGMASKIATSLLMIFFPITSACYDGLRRTPQGWIELTQLIPTQRWRLLFYIKLPAALPTIASGLRIAAVIAPIGAIVGEWVGASQGLGYLMLYANARMQIDLMFAALIIIIMLSLALYFTVDGLLRRLIWWHTAS